MVHHKNSNLLKDNINSFKQKKEIFIWHKQGIICDKQSGRKIAIYKAEVIICLNFLKNS